MSTYWDLHCRTCGVDGNVINWNHGADRGLRDVIALLPALAQLGTAYRQTQLDLELRFLGPETQSGLLDFAVDHAGHEVVCKNEYGQFDDPRRRSRRFHAMWRRGQDTVTEDPNLTKIAALRDRVAELSDELAEVQADNADLIKRRDELLALIANLSQTVPLESEVGEALEQRGALLAEIGTLRSKLNFTENARDDSRLLADVQLALIEELQEKLRIAEAVRDDARATSARDLEAKRVVEERLAHTTQRSVVAALMEQNAKIFKTIDAARTQMQQDAAEKRRLLELGKIVADTGVANTPVSSDRVTGWQKGVVESIDKLTAYQMNVGGLTYDKALELLNNLYQHPPTFGTTVITREQLIEDQTYKTWVPTAADGAIIGEPLAQRLAMCPRSTIGAHACVNYKPENRCEDCPLRTLPQEEEPVREQCGDCGAEIIGHHACQGVPGRVLRCPAAFRRRRSRSGEIVSWDDKRFMARGFRVRHKYKRRRGCHSVCERCGVKRRRTSSGWEYRPIPASKWTASNPPCVKR